MIKKESIDIYVKITPLIILLFLICNYIFNVGYFSILGIKFISLLELQDYYEGTAAFITIVFMLGFSFFNFLMYTKALKKFPSYCKSLYNAYIYMPIKLCIMRIILWDALRILKKKKPEKGNYTLKKKCMILLKEMKVLRSTNSQFKISFIKEINLFVCPLLVIFIPFYILYTYVYNVDILLFIIMGVLYSIYVLLVLCCKKLNVINISIFMIFVFIYLFGIWSYLRNYNISGSSVIVNNQEKMLIRPLARGVLIKDENDVIFVQWDNVDKIIKRNASKNSK